MGSDGTPLDDDFVTRSRRFARVSALVAMLAGVLVLAGWTMDIEILKALYAGITMKANAAIALLLAGSSLWLLVTRPTTVRRTWLGVGAAGGSGLIGVATLSQHLLGVNLGIDQLLFVEEPGAIATTSPGRMGPPASICFALSGIALVLLHTGRSTAIAQLLALLMGLAAMLPLTGYAYGVETLYGVARFTGIALHTAIGLLLLSFGIIAASIDRGVFSVFASAGAGSQMARRLLLIAVAVPLLLGWLRIRLEVAGYFDSGFGVAALTLTIILVLTTIIIRAAAGLNRAESQRLRAEASLKERVHELETMMDLLPIGVFITTDREAGRIKGNRAAREFLRIPEVDDNLSLTAPNAEAPNHFRVMKGGQEVPPDQLPMQIAAREGVPVPETELEIVFSDGVVKHELISARPLIGANGKPRGAIAALMDISARRASELEREELLVQAREAQAAAEAASRSKDEFLATVSHELRTPLNAILGWASMLQEGVVDDEETRTQALATIERNCRAQAQLVDDLLDVSRIVAGRLRLEVRPIDFVGVVNSAIDVVRPQADARRISLLTTFSATNAPVVSGDSTRLQQIVWNLLSNAVKFSPEGQTVEVSVAVEHGEVVLTVADNGTGIDSRFLPHIFDRFRQADGTKTRRHGGLGLGLSIARDLVELHGGTLEASSDGPGRGARFVMRLPAAAPEMAMVVS